MTEVPCFLTYTKVGIFGDCTPVNDPTITFFQLAPIILGAIVGIGLVYFGIKHWKEKRTLQKNQEVKESKN